MRPPIANMITAAVIIPYFQTRDGILRRALGSVLSQDLSPDVHVNVIVVDDGSPVPAQGEIVGLSIPTTFQLRLIQQPNRGVGGARNTALRELGDDTDYVAFLDSDDIWRPTHLASAISTLELGYDFYFCDTQRLGDPKTAFAERSFHLFLSSPNAKAVSVSDGVFEVEKEGLFNASFSGRVFCIVFRIQATVYRRSIAQDLAFDPSLRIVGEDSLFLLQLICRCHRIACSTKLLVFLADGVNIYSSKHGWDEPEHLELNMGRIIAFYSWRRHLHLSGENKQFLDNQTRNAKRQFAYLTIRYFLKYRALWSKSLLAMIRSDKTFWSWYPYSAICVIIDYVIFSKRPIDRLTDRSARDLTVLR